MGFFTKDEPEERLAAARKPAVRAPKADRILDPTARGCEHCSLKANWSWIATPQMPISGNTKDPDILVLGEAPGEQEDKKGVAFIGDSGELLRRVMPGIQLERVAFQNTVRCRPRDNATPSARDAHACSIHLEEDIARLPIKAILGIGSVPLSRYVTGQAITRIHGTRFPIKVGAKTLWYYPVLHPSFVLRGGGERRSPAFPVLKSDVKRFFAEVDKWPAPKMWTPQESDVLLPRSLTEARNIEARMSGPRGVDLETTGLRFAVDNAKILTAAISDQNTTIAFPVFHPEAPTEWGLRFLLEVVGGRRWVAHNACFELVWMLHAAAQAGIKFAPAPFEDSMALLRIYHERETLLGLDIGSRIHLGADFKSVVKVNRNNIINEPLSRVLPYNGLDALASVLIHKELRNKVDDSNYFRLLGAVRSTAQMELMGLDADPDASEELKLLWQGKREEASDAARTIYEVRQFEQAKQIEFNIGSPKHVGDALVEFGRLKLPKTDKGEGEGWSTQDQDLRAAGPDNPLVLAVLDYREAQKLEGTYVDSVIEGIATNFDGRIHPAYTTMLTATLRLSSEAPNIQNFPKRRHRELRRQIVAPVGHVLVSFDYGQLEARVFGFATKDINLCTSTIKGIDIHGKWRDRVLVLHPPYIDYLARKTNETNEEKIRKGGRDIIKTDFVFSSFFGGTAGSCSERTGIPLHIVEQMLAEFWVEHKGVLDWIKDRRREYAETGSVRLLTGVARHGIMNGNEPINTPIQGTAAQIVVEAQNAMSQMSRDVGDPYLHPRINIHDDLTFVWPDNDDRIEEYIKITAAELLKIRFDWQIVPLAVEVKIGKDWSEFEEITTIVGDYLR